MNQSKIAQKNVENQLILNVLKTYVKNQTLMEQF
jgi:hypothetical protein